VLTDLTVYEDPAYGVEPVLHASSVTAAIRLFSLWRGELEISSISVDDASVNVVHTADGRWNLESIFRTAAARTRGTASGTAPPFPYLEATNSRVNIKRGLEKLPFSLVNADLSFWQETPGDWRLRLRGQPARTDVNLDLADTGIVRLEATLRHASDIRLVPTHLEMEWRQAQLGQLSRLVVGSDPGWRGDLTGQFQLEGTGDEAQVKTRLSATNVHRAEFAPAEALDFDANCGFTFHYASRAIENISCDSPLGDGHIKLSGAKPAGELPRFSVDMQRIPLSAGLDVLRTLRNGIDPDLEAGGTLTGQLKYDPALAQSNSMQAAPKRHRGDNGAVGKTGPVAVNPLSGSLVMEGFSLTGGGLTRPIQAAKVVWAAEADAATAGQALETSVVIPAGGTSPLSVTTQVSRDGYVLNARGSVGLPRLRELAHLLGAGDDPDLSNISAESAIIDLNAHGSWLPSQSTPLRVVGERQPPTDTDSVEPLSTGSSDQIRGTIVLHNARWISTALANEVDIDDGTLNISADGFEWNPVVFHYGPVNGTASLQTFPGCDADKCVPRLSLQFSELDAAALQSALLGARKQDSTFASLVARFTQNRGSVWPRLDATIKADLVTLGLLRLQNATIDARVLPTTAEVTSVDAGILGGEMHASGKITNGDKPAYTFEGTFAKVTGQALCQFLALQCTGGSIEGEGKVELSGFAASELASSATGALHFDWRRGSVSGSSIEIPKELSRFDRWATDGTIADGAFTLTQSQVERGGASSHAEGTVTFGNPPEVKVRAVTAGDAARN
jgi:hypothetical protein